MEQANVYDSNVFCLRLVFKTFFDVSNLLKNKVKNNI